MPDKKFLSSDEVYEDLCIKIEKVIYMPGERLSENDLCKVYGVSRHIVRNAITRLKDRKLVEVYPQRGTFVSLIDMSYVADILYLRESVEQEAIARIMVDDKKRLAVADAMAEKAEKMEEILNRGELTEEFYQIDNEMHRCILEAVGRQNVMDIISDSYIHFKRWRNFEARTPERVEQIREQHWELIQNFRDGDAQKARELLHRHLDTVFRYHDNYQKEMPQYFAPTI